MSVSTDLKKGVTKNRVAYLLSKYSKTRENDKLLLISYLMIWHRLHKRIGAEAMAVVKEVIFDEMPSFESIRRIRQKFQEGGAYLPPKEVIKARAEEEVAVREWSRE